MTPEALREQYQKVKLFIRGRKYAYTRVFKGPLGDAVLDDLAEYCFAHKSTFNPDPRISANLDGRREVYLRILSHLNVDESELFKRATGLTTTP